MEKADRSISWKGYTGQVNKSYSVGILLDIALQVNTPVWFSNSRIDHYDLMAVRTIVENPFRKSQTCLKNLGLGKIENPGMNRISDR